LKGGGALLENDYLENIRQAGFVDVRIASRYRYHSEEMLGWAEGRYSPSEEERTAIEALDQQLSSITITARKP
jgi:hypothetical protein